MSNNGIPPLNDWQSDNYPVIYDEGDATLKYVKTGNKVDINTGGSSYLVYNARLSGGIAEAPTVITFKDDLGGDAWVREGEGVYTKLTATDYDPTKIYIPNEFVRTFGNGVENGFRPFYDAVNTTLLGYYHIVITDEGTGKMTLWLETYNVDGDALDLGASDPLNSIMYPEIRVYP